ncbi:MAG: hypothetical protein AAFZ07_28410 [Actinomycetota bacterium]
MAVIRVAECGIGDVPVITEDGVTTFHVLRVRDPHGLLHDVVFPDNIARTIVDTLDEQLGERSPR